MKIAHILLSIFIGTTIVTPAYSMQQQQVTIEELITKQAIVKLVSTDEQEFELLVAAARHSKTIGDLIEDTGVNQSIPLPNIDGATLEQIVKLLEALESLDNVYQKTNEVLKNNALTHEEINNKKTETLCEVLKKLPMKITEKLFIASNYLDISPLTNASIICFGKWLMTGKWELEDSIFKNLPKVLKNVILDHLFKNAHRLFPPFVILQCKTLGNAMAKSTQVYAQPLTFEQCLTCIHLIRNKITGQKIRELTNKAYHLSDEVIIAAQKSCSPYDIFTIAEHGTCALIEFYLKEAQDPEKLKILLQKPEPIMGTTLLHYATQKNTVEVVTLLTHYLQKHDILKEQLELKDNYKTILHIAVESGNIDTLKLIFKLLKEYGLLQKQFETKYSSKTVLMRAAEQEDTKIFTFFIENIKEIYPSVEQLNLIKNDIWKILESAAQARNKKVAQLTLKLIETLEINNEVKN